MEGGWTHSEEAEVADMVEEHLPKNKNERGRVGVGSKRRKGYGE